MTAFSALRPMDKIAAVNGYELPEPLTVGTVEPGKVRLIPNRESVVEWWLYEDQHTVVLVQPEPQPEPPAKPRRSPSRYVENLRLVSQGGKHWATSDNQTFVQREDGYTFCDAEHPVRITPALVEWARANPASDGAYEVLRAQREGKRGYVCGGSAEHTYDVWTVMYQGEWLGDIADTFSEALDLLRDAIRAASQE
jgi:hypothetical protein